MSVISSTWSKIRQIRIKVTLALSGVFLLLLSVLIALNALFMDDYIVWRTHIEMSQSADQFAQAIKTRPYYEVLPAFRIKSSALINYTENGFKEIEEDYKGPSFKEAPGRMAGFGASTPDPAAKNYLENKDAVAQALERAKISKNHSDATVVNSRMVDTANILYLRLFDDGSAVLFMLPMKHVYRTIEMNQMFLIQASIWIFLLAFIINFLISTVIGKKVNILSEKTRKMWQLDFSDPIKIHSVDEIGQLSTNINELSKKLESVIEDLKDSNEMLSVELQKERSMEQMRRQFVSDVSHELKNPLSMIQGYADGLYHNIPKTDEDQKYYQSVIVKEADKLGKLLKDLLDLSSYESGVFKLSCRQLRFNDLVEEAIARYHVLSEEKNIVIHSSLGDVLPVHGDQIRLDQVVSNLLTNAIKYTQSGGQIVIRTEMDKTHIVLAIANSGRLLTDEERNNIWHSFHQIDSSKSGSGLGLAIVRSIVKMHRGACGVRVEDGMNAFYVKLPVEEPCNGQVKA